MSKLKVRIKESYRLTEGILLRDEIYKELHLDVRKYIFNYLFNLCCDGDNPIYIHPLNRYELATKIRIEGILYLFESVLEDFFEWSLNKKMSADDTYNLLQDELEEIINDEYNFLKEREV